LLPSFTLCSNTTTFWLTLRSEQLEDYYRNHTDPPHARILTRADPETLALQSAAELAESAKQKFDDQGETLGSPSEIQRPRSALHAGDFTQEHASTSRPDQSSQSGLSKCEALDEPLGISPSTPWYTPLASAAYSPFQTDPRFPSAEPISAEARILRSRAPSLSSYSSSFVLKPPTSPLVQQSNNTDLDFSPIDLSTSPGNNNRRHTLPPSALQSLHSSPPGELPTLYNGTRISPTMHREGPRSHHGHQPRRSLTSNWSLQAVSSHPSPPFLSSRRPSLSDVSPLHHAPMVGSYEESILRGRMSTTPSRPLNFTAQIGVLGKGNCKPNLRCPPHVIVPFPAVFYSYGTGNGRKTVDVEEGPSPYVGLIDIENSLTHEETKERRRRNISRPAGDLEGSEGEVHGLGEQKPTKNLLDRRRTEKKKRRSQSPKTPPGGSYRIPQQGQLQIVIKNPNKTAVKLFLVPYDLQGMEPGSKTFVRQRSYSAGPIIDMPLTSKFVSEKDKAETLNSDVGNPKDRPTLRYLIHLNICSTAKGRYYLYQSIRVVFANRVPDGKEKLRNETESPSPRYSSYKPGKPSGSGQGSNSTASTEKALRRRSLGFALGAGGLDAMDGIGYPTQLPFIGGNMFSFNGTTTTTPPIQPIPFDLVRSRKDSIEHSIDENMDIDSLQPATESATRSPTSDRAGNLPMSLASPEMSTSWRSNSSNNNYSSSSSDEYSKLRKGDVEYGGNVFGPFGGGGDSNEGLLARRLRGLGVQKSLPHVDHD
jgi:hypothetical protein